MKLFDKLEHNKSFLFLLAISTVFFLLRLPSIIEPYWYGDEGIYQVIGQAINNGRLLYSEIWDNKPPLLYILYALFNGDQPNIRFFSLLVGILSTIAFFFLAKKLFQRLLPSIAATVLFTLLFATPFIEGNIANAENFMLLPIILAGLLIYQTSSLRGAQKATLQSSWGLLRFARNDVVFFVAGLLLGIAFLFKIVAVFDLAAFIVFFLIISLDSSLRAKRSNLMKKIAALLSVARNDVIPLILGFLLPLLITILYFLSQHAFSDFIRGAFLGNVGYVGYGNKFLNIPQGLLLFKLLLLAIVVSILFLKRNKFSKPVLFILLWLSFSLFNAFFSQRPYTHYLLVLLPSACLFVGLLFTAKTNKLRIIMLLTLLILGLTIKENFWMHSLKGTVLYYQNTAQFLTGKKDVKSYQSFFDKKAPRDYELASFIKKHTNTSDNVFIWGNNAQIYALSDKLPPNRYTVAYHITQSKEAIRDTQNAINEVKPKYIITLSEAPLLPFTIPFYTMRFTLPRATIYERIF